MSARLLPTLVLLTLSAALLVSEAVAQQAKQRGEALNDSRSHASHADARDNPESLQEAQPLPPLSVAMGATVEGSPVSSYETLFRQDAEEAVSRHYDRSVVELETSSVSPTISRRCALGTSLLAVAFGVLGNFGSAEAGPPSRLWGTILGAVGGAGTGAVQFCEGW